MFAEIPIVMRPAGTMTPFGYVANGEEQKIIDMVTAACRHDEPDVCPWCMGSGRA